MLTPNKDSFAKGSPFASPFERSNRSPFGNAGSVLNSGKPRGARPSHGLYETGLIYGKSSSLILEEASSHRVVSYGQALPVQVTEALSVKHSAPISCKFDPSGWAWLVNGKQLFVWKYVPSVLNKNISCCEFCLPTSDLPHRAKLTCVMPADVVDIQYASKDFLASVVNISPEGVIRFWSNISGPGIFIESSVGCRGKEFHTLTAFPPYGCIALTSDGEVLLISPSQGSITSHSLNDSSGLLSGIGRKMSLFLYGSQSSSSAKLHLPILAMGPGEVLANERHFYLLANGNLQKWVVMNGKEKLLSQVDLLEKFSNDIFNVLEMDPDALVKIKPLDITSTGYCLAVLACAVIRTISGYRVIPLLGTMQSSGKDFASSFESLIPLEYSTEVAAESDVPDYELLIPRGSYQAFIFNKDIITANPVSEATSSLVEIKFPSESAKVVGGGSFGTDAVFLSRRHGLFNVVAYCKDPPSSVRQMDSTSDIFVSKPPKEPSMDSTKRGNVKPIAPPGEDLQELLTKAFYKHCEGNLFEATELISMISSETSLNDAVIAIGNEIIDALPASDPRWAQHTDSGNKATTDSVLILKQLQDKERVFDFFLKFLNDVEIFDKLTVYHEDEDEFYTKFKLCEQAEKLSAAQALQLICLKEGNFVQQVIKSVVEKKMEDIPGSLTHQDIFFREVSRIQDLFPSLWDHEENIINQETSIMKQIEIIMRVNNVIISALKDAWFYRQSKASFYYPKLQHSYTIQYIPWTARDGAGGIRPVLKKQIEVTVDKGLLNTDNAATTKVLLQEIVDLSDLLLDGYVTQLQFLKAAESDCTQLKLEFEKERKSVIEPLIEQEHYKMALALAEKYEDYTLMISICEKEGNSEKIAKYKETLADKGFLDFLFKWYLDRGELGKLLSQGSSPQLEQFLSSHNDLSWLHFIGTGEYEKASEVLKRSARNERSYLARKKTMLSIGKLCLLASEERDDSIDKCLEDIHNELDVVLHQETLPSSVIEKSGIDVDNMPPISVEDLIELYTGEENANADEYDFKRALDLVNFLDPIKKPSVSNSIWCKCILRDNWSSNIPGDPVARVRETLLYRCARLYDNQTTDIKTIIPTLDVLQNSDELRRHELSSNDNFLFLMKVFYESIAVEISPGK